MKRDGALPRRLEGGEVDMPTLGALAPDLGHMIVDTITAMNTAAHGPTVVDKLIAGHPHPGAPEWRPCVGAPKYEVSSCGEVRNAATHRMLTPQPNDGGYLRVGLLAGTRRSFKRIHVLVLEAFKTHRPTPKHHGAHEDGNKLNNHATNLTWKLPPANEADKKLHGTAPKGGANKATSKRVVKAIRAGVAKGESYSSIGRRLKPPLHRHSVSRIARGLRRKTS